MTSVEPLVQLVIILIVFGVLLAAIQRFLQMDQLIKGIAMFVVVLIAAILVLRAFGIVLR
ncbi:MAG TPA: Thivi_2564 family membrane protein [Actinomycetes bacterium]|nr:Thivi_2564 family membrane protein [Actinomycetes bacterium]